MDRSDKLSLSEGGSIPTDYPLFAKEETEIEIYSKVTKEARAAEPP